MIRKQVGFKALKVTKLKDFFYVMIFQRSEAATDLKRTEDFSAQLKPCMYKKRWAK